MPTLETVTYLLLNSHQGRSTAEGWHAQHLQNLQLTLEGLQLATVASLPVSLKDAEGSFGGLENPTGVAIDSEGAIYISDCERHLIFKVERQEKFRPQAYFFTSGKGAFVRDRFVYIPIVNRLERWPRQLRHEPSSFSEVEVICEKVWSETQARQLILSFIEAEGAESIEKEWQGDYPTHLPGGSFCKTSISPLPYLGGLGSEPRQLNKPQGLVISPAGHLYVADSQNHRIQVFDLRGLVLKAIWGKRAAAAEMPPLSSSTEDSSSPVEQRIRFGQPQAGEAPGEFDRPWDIAIDREGNAYVADRGNHRLQKFDCRTRRFAIIDGTILSSHFFQVLYGSQNRERFVFILARHRLEQWPHSLGRAPSNIGEVLVLSENVSDLKAARQLVLETIDAVGAKDILVEWDAVYPEALEPTPETPFESPTHLAIDGTGRLYVVDADRDYVKVLDLKGHVLGRVNYVEEVFGSFQPTAIVLDAEGKLLLANGTRIERFQLEGETSHYDGCYATWQGRCQGMAVDAGGRIFAVGGELGKVTEIPHSQGWEMSGTYISQALDSGIERCQWHKILLNLATEIPLGTSLTLSTYTSETKLEDILALEAEDWQTGQTNGQDFLILSPPGRWLWLRIEFKGNGVATPVLKGLKVYFPRITYLQYLPAVYQADPASKDFLERFLSIFETVSLSIEHKIDRFSQYLDPDGVPEDFLSWLSAWVDLLFDPSWSEVSRRRLLRYVPELYRQRGTSAGLKKLLELALGLEIKILEHFQMRRWLFLSSQSSLGEFSQLWGNSIVSRLQLEENSRIGNFTLVSTGDPLRDPFHVYAHKFSVFIPAALCRSELTERLLRRLIDLEKPSHTSYELCKVEPHLRIGIQSTVGLDTLVGDYPHLVLNYCSTLGYDTVLSAAPEERESETLKVGERSRVGVNTVVR